MTICLVESHSQDATANAGKLSLLHYASSFLYRYQLFIVIKGENIAYDLDCVSFIELLSTSNHLSYSVCTLLEAVMI